MAEYAEYIERYALIKRLCERCNEEMSESPCEPSDCFVREVIKTIPAADVSPVRHTRWLEVREKRLFGEHYFLCSNCKSRNGLMIPFNYCHNCGAKMDKKKENEV